MTENPRVNDRPFPRSVQSLARLALQESGADGFAIYQLDPDGDQPMSKCREGLEAPDNLQAGDCEVSFPLSIDDGVTGRLSFVFRDSAVNLSPQLLLDFMRGATVKLHCGSHARPARFLEPRSSS